MEAFFLADILFRNVLIAVFFWKPFVTLIGVSFNITRREKCIFKPRDFNFLVYKSVNVLGGFVFFSASQNK